MYQKQVRLEKNGWSVIKQSNKIKFTSHRNRNVILLTIFKTVFGDYTKMADKRVNILVLDSFNFMTKKNSPSQNPGKKRTIWDESESNFFFLSFKNKLREMIILSEIMFLEM